jgi:hypothetical protein
MKLLPRLLTSRACVTTLTAVLLAAVFAFGAGQTVAAQSGGMGGMGGMGGSSSGDNTSDSSGSGHNGSMTNEDPVPFTRDMERAAADILTQVKAGRAMDARNSVSRLSAAIDKLVPHITDTGLKDRLTTAVNDIKTIASARSPDLFDLEDKVDALQIVTEEARKALQNMN